MLLLRSGYFLEREIENACARLGWPVAGLDIARGKTLEPAFLAALLDASARFVPDFALTVNHLGLDQKGLLLSCFERMRLPVASWFVDSPRLILHEFSGQQNSWCALFAWDRDTVAPLRALGFESVTYLPLATDTTVFAPGRPRKSGWSVPVGFVGDSMVTTVRRLRQRLDRFPGLADKAREAAGSFAQSEERLADTFLAKTAPQLGAGLPSARERLDLEQYVTFEATRQSRLERVRALLPFGPLVAGDSGWKSLLPSTGWSHHPPLDYYADLPGFYPACAVNVNATSMQMKGAVNQRVFDIPACGGFVLTDARDQLAELFEPDRESAIYATTEELSERVRHALAHPEYRVAVTQAARQRILAQHDYTHRLTTLFKTLRRRYA
ncbi:hypothetical protein JCM15519_27320 [Fundidesulfovibrio butyratiphilus]